MINGASTTPETTTVPKQMGTAKCDRPATPRGRSNGSVDAIEAHLYVNCFLDCRSLDMDCKRMSDDKTKMISHQESGMWIKAVQIFEQAVYEDL